VVKASLNLPKPDRFRIATEGPDTTRNVSLPKEPVGLVVCGGILQEKGKKLKRKCENNAGLGGKTSPRRGRKGGRGSLFKAEKVSRGTGQLKFFERKRKVAKGPD